MNDEQFLTILLAVYTTALLTYPSANGRLGMVLL